MKLSNGYVSSIYNGSAVDGDGLRCVVFFSGCNLKCGFCHNIETLLIKGQEYSVEQLATKLLRYKNYITNGGVTLSGGEPFLQADFCIDLISVLAQNGVKTAIETNGHLVNEKLIALSEYLIVDIKNQETNDLTCYKEFLSTCQKLGKRVELTCVIIENLNDSEQKLAQLKGLKEEFSCVTNIRLLPFKKLCEEKYKKLGVCFPYGKYDECSLAHAIKLQGDLNK